MSALLKVGGPDGHENQGVASAQRIVVHLDAPTRGELQLIVVDWIETLTKGGQLDETESKPTPRIPLGDKWGGWLELQHRLALITNLGLVLAQIGWPTGGPRVAGRFEESEAPAEGCALRLERHVRRALEFIQTRLQDAEAEQEDEEHRKLYSDDLAVVNRALGAEAEG